MPSYLETAVDIARESGALLSNFLERKIGFELKGTHDLVTEADRASERLVVERLRTHFPSHGIVAEEGGGHESNSQFRWYVDPLDGTTNFAHGFPVFNVTLALEQAGEIVAGVVFDPTRQELFTAEKGGGAYLNNRRIHVSKVRALESSLVATGFPNRRRHENVNIHFYYQMAMITHGAINLGGLPFAYPSSAGLPAQIGIAFPIVFIALALLATLELRRVLITTRWITRPVGTTRVCVSRSRDLQTPI